MRYEEYIKNQLDIIKKNGLIDIDSMPDMEVYIDQVETLFAKSLGGIDSETVRRYFTKSHINNYVKNHMIPRPDGKKYSRIHLIMTAMTAYFKGIFKMEKIEQLMKPLVENQSSEFDEKIDAAMLYNTASSLNKDFPSELTDRIDRDMAAIKKRFSDAEQEDDQMEVFTLLLAIAQRADMERYLASSLLEEYFAK